MKRSPVLNVAELALSSPNFEYVRPTEMRPSPNGWSSPIRVRISGPGWNDVTESFASLKGSYSAAYRMDVANPRFHEPADFATANPPVMPNPLPKPEIGKLRKSLPIRVAASS